jgi:intergrase/recombinase
MEEYYTVLTEQKYTIPSSHSSKKWININIKIREDELPILNQRLKLLGFETMGQLTKGIINSTFPHVTEDKQIMNLSDNADKSGLKSVLEGGDNTDFYKKVNSEDMYHYYLNIRRYQRTTARDLVSYFKRFREDFFSPSNVHVLRSLSSRMRSRVMDSMRKFGQYYLYKYNNEDCSDLIEKIIRRNNLNQGMNEHGKLYIVDDSYLENKIKQLFSIDGELGTVVKFGMYSGLREDEMVYVYNNDICPDKSGCYCDRLHVVEKPEFGVSVVLINWHRKHKRCFFSIVPIDLLKEFKALPKFSYRPHITTAHQYMKVKTEDDKITFMWLRKAHYNVMCRVMKPFEANVLAGRTNSVDAKHYAMYELDEMSEKYTQAWKKFI